MDAAGAFIESEMNRLITTAGTDITKIPPELWTGGDSSEPPSPPWNALQAPPFQFSPGTLTKLSDSRGRDSFAGALAAAAKQAFGGGWVSFAARAAHMPQSSGSTPDIEITPRRTPASRPSARWPPPSH